MPPCILALAAVLAAPAAAQQGSIVVTGSRLEAAETATTIIDREEIKRAQPVTLLDPLDRVAGVRAFSKGGLSYLSIRGGDPNFTLVLIDGVRVNDPTNSRGGAFDFEQIDPYAIERIEIARSALSAVHGADALSGVVHLRLRSPKEGESFGSARALADSEGAAGVNGTAGLGWSGGGLLLSAGWFDSGDLFEGADFSRRQALARASQEIGPFDASALAMHASGERFAFPEDSGGPRLAVIRERERRDSNFSLAALELVRREGPAFRPRLTVSWTRQRSKTDTPAIAPGIVGPVPPIVADTIFERVEALGELRLRASPALSAAFGASLIRERGDSTGFIDFGVPLPGDFSIDRTIRSLFAEASADLDPVRLTAGVRFDDPSSEDGVVTFRAGASLRLSDSTLLFADFSEGYKLPSLYALAFPIIANPDLRPERNRSLSAGIEHRIGRGRLRVALFQNRFRDLIDFDVDNFTNVNRGRVRSRGVELEAELPLGRTLSLDGALTWMDVDNAPGAPPLRSRPEWQGALALGWRPGERLTLNLLGRFNSDSFDSSVPTGLILQPGHARVDAEALVALSDRLALRVTGRNLLDERYEEAVGFPAPGRLVRAALEMRF